MYNEWLSSYNRKVHQRALNHTMRMVNEGIEEDTLWRGRFVVKQIGSNFHFYSDGSGGYLWAILCLIDKKTGQYKIMCDNANHWSRSGHLGWDMNNFIVQDCKVWENEGREELYEKDKNQYANWKVEIKGTWNLDIKITNPNGEVIEGKRVY